MALTRSVLRRRLADWLDRLQVDIGLLDVRFRGKTLRVEIGGCSFQWEKWRSSRAAYDRITRGNPSAPGESVLCKSRGAVQETRDVDSCKRSSTVADLTELPSPSQGQRLSLHDRQIKTRAPPSAAARSWRHSTRCVHSLAKFKNAEWVAEPQLIKLEQINASPLWGDLCTPASHRTGLPHLTVSTRKLAKHLSRQLAALPHQLRRSSPLQRDDPFLRGVLSFVLHLTALHCSSRRVFAGDCRICDGWSFTVTDCGQQRLLGLQVTTPARSAPSRSLSLPKVGTLPRPQGLDTDNLRVSRRCNPSDHQLIWTTRQEEPRVFQGRGSFFTQPFKNASGRGRSCCLRPVRPRSSIHQCLCHHALGSLALVASQLKPPPVQSRRSRVPICAQCYGRLTCALILDLITITYGNAGQAVSLDASW